MAGAAQFKPLLEKIAGEAMKANPGLTFGGSGEGTEDGGATRMAEIVLRPTDQTNPSNLTLELRQTGSAADATNWLTEHAERMKNRGYRVEAIKPEQFAGRGAFVATKAGAQPAYVVYVKPKERIGRIEYVGRPADEATLAPITLVMMVEALEPGAGTPLRAARCLPAAAPAEPRCARTVADDASDSYESKPADAFDCAGKLWNAGDTSGWIQAGFAQPESLSGVHLSVCATSTSTVKFVVWASNDGKAWQQLGEEQRTVVANASRGSAGCDKPEPVAPLKFPSGTDALLKIEGSSDSSWLSFGHVKLLR